MDEQAPTTTDVLIAILQTLNSINDNIVAAANNSSESLEQLDSRLSELVASVDRIDDRLMSMESDLSRAGNAVVELESTVSITTQSSLSSIESSLSTIESSLDGIETLMPQGN